MSENHDPEIARHGPEDEALARTTLGQEEPCGPGAFSRRILAPIGRRLAAFVLLFVVVVPPAAAFYSYLTGIPLSFARQGREALETADAAEAPRITLVKQRPHALDVPEAVARSLGILKEDAVAIAVARVPTRTRPLVLPGSTMFDTARLARVRARFAPARVVQVGRTTDWSRLQGETEVRELRKGDWVSKGDHLGTFFSVEVGSKKNDLLDALVQLELDQKVLDDAEKHAEAVPRVLMNTFYRAVQGDRNAIHRAMSNLQLWDIPQEEIEALHVEAKKIGANKDAWHKTPEGRWVRGEKQARAGATGDPTDAADNIWGRVTLRAPFDGVIVERNVHHGEMVVDNTVNLFQIADVSQMVVIAWCPEDTLPTLEALAGDQKRWTIRTVGAPSGTGLPGMIDEIGYVIDQNQHTVGVTGHVQNTGKHLRAGQYVTATVDVPPPSDVVEVPTDAVVEDGLQSLVFIQADAAISRFAMRRVHVTHRFERTVFVRATPVPEEEQLTARDAEEGLLPRANLQAGERVLLAGVVELKAALLDLESRPAKTPTEHDPAARRPPGPSDGARPE
jgi:cobalt-zinc-cadmium efflux system membrane fusion protein